jgi:hypothetical protein
VKESEFIERMRIRAWLYTNGNLQPSDDDVSQVYQFSNNKYSSAREKIDEKIKLYKSVKVPRAQDKLYNALYRLKKNKEITLPRGSKNMDAMLQHQIKPVFEHFNDDTRVNSLLRATLQSHLLGNDVTSALVMIILIRYETVNPHPSDIKVVKEFCQQFPRRQYDLEISDAKLLLHKVTRIASLAHRLGQKTPFYIPGRVDRATYTRAYRELRRKTVFTCKLGRD